MAQQGEMFISDARGHYHTAFGAAALPTVLPRPIARTVDPQTSHESALRHEQSGQLGRECAAVLAALEAWERSGRPAPTSAELGGGDAAQRYVFARRLADLRDRHGAVWNPTGDDGLPLTRRDAVTGRRGMLWATVRR